MHRFRTAGRFAATSPPLALLALCVIGACSYGAEFKLSFLDTDAVLSNTCSMLKSNGFGESIVKEFRRLVEHHNRNGNRVELGKFPLPYEGYYYFVGVGDFTGRLSAFFSGTPGDTTLQQSTLTCFDTAVLMLKGAGHEAARLFEGFDSKEIVVVSSDRHVEPAVEVTFREGVGLLAPPDSYKYLVGRPRTEAETGLGLCLRAARKVHLDLTDSDKDLRAAFANWVFDVKGDGFAFPRNFRLGLVFYVDVRRHFIVADHAFICIPTAEHLVSLEKNNSRGPYVRAEFNSEKDLALYSSLAERWDTNNPKDVDYGASVIVALNDGLIGIFRPAGSK